MCYRSTIEVIELVDDRGTPLLGDNFSKKIKNR